MNLLTDNRLQLSTHYPLSGYRDQWLVDSGECTVSGEWILANG